MLVGVEPRRLLVLGDTHGNVGFVRRAVERGVKKNCDGVLQLGDFGVWPKQRGVWYLDDVDRILEKAGVDLWFVDGNHEDHAQLAKARSRLRETSTGMVPLRRHIRYLPRGLRWSWHGVRFGALGGAFSIDCDSRIAGVNWWPGMEELSEDDVLRLGDDPLDVLVCHDAPASARVPGGFNLSSSLHNRAWKTRELLDEAVAATHPRLVLHGHHHRRCRTAHPDGYVVEGLAHDASESTALGFLNLPALDFDAPPVSRS